MEPTQLYKLEYYLEEGVKSVLTTSGSIANVYTFEDSASDDLQTPCVMISAQVEEATENRESLSTYDFRDTWNVNLETQIQTNRTRNKEQHHEYVSLVRYWLSDGRYVKMPYHEINHMKESSTQRSVSDDLSVDETTITFALHLSVKPTVWSASIS